MWQNEQNGCGGGVVVQLDDLDGWRDSFEAFHARFAHLFVRRESREQAAKYLRGLLAPVERKNGWQVAEAVGDATPDRMQRLLYRVDWDADAARDVLQRFVIETFGHPDGIGVLDETGFLKKGTHSVGVQRQYSGTAGKIENCQIGVFLTYSTPTGHVFLDRRLYLPESWCQDTASWPADQWQRFSVAEGEKGPRVYDWGCVRVIESRHQLPGPEVWLLVRRSVSDPTELAYYLALAPWETTLEEMAVVAATRYTVEQCLEEAKGETGLDHYEVRHWTSWYRHITLSMLAHAWLFFFSGAGGGEGGGGPRKKGGGEGAAG